MINYGKIWPGLNALLWQRLLARGHAIERVGWAVGGEREC